MACSRGEYLSLDMVSISLLLSIPQPRSLYFLKMFMMFPPHPRPRVLSHVVMNLARGGATMSVVSPGAVQLGIGGDKVEHCVYVAPLQDDMHLGIDFLQNYWVK